MIFQKAGTEQPVVVANRIGSVDVAEAAAERLQSKSLPILETAAAAGVGNRIEELDLGMDQYRA